MLRFNSPLAVRLLGSQKKRLEKYADKYNMTESEIIREAISIWLNAQTM